MALSVATFGINCRAESEQVTEISSYSDFLKIADNLSGSYKLTSDITAPKGTLFIPFGDSDNPFCGTLDGDGHTVKNITLASNEGNSVCLGIFACNNGTVKDLVIDNITNESIKKCKYLYAGTVAGINFSKAVIKNCVVKGNLTVKCDDCSYIYVGGIVGRNSGMFFESVTSMVDVVVDTDASVTAGGLCSENVKGAVWRSECYGKINVRADGDCYVGGIAGKLANSGTRLQDNRCDMDITTGFNNVNENIYVGGIVANTEGSAETTVCMNVFSGTINAKPSGSMITATRKFYVAPVAASGNYTETSLNNYYLPGTSSLRQSNAVNITARESNVGELREIFKTRSDFWTIPEDTEKLPAFSEVTLCETDFIRELDKNNFAVVLNAQLSAQRKNRGGLSVKENFTVKKDEILNYKAVPKVLCDTLKTDLTVYMPCDINGDYKVSASDLVAIRNIVLVGQTEDARELLAAENDNADGITVTDVIFVLEAILKQ